MVVDGSECLSLICSPHKHIGAPTKYLAGPVLPWTHHAWPFFGEEGWIPGRGGRLVGRKANASQEVRFLWQVLSPRLSPALHNGDNGFSRALRHPASS